MGHLTNTFTIAGITLGPRERNGNTSCEEEERGVQVAAVCGGEVDTALRETGRGDIDTRCFHGRPPVRGRVLVHSL